MPPTAPEPRSSRELLRATLFAALAALALLFVVVLPAEYGIDALGTGRALGILRPALAEVSAEAAEMVPAADAAAGAALAALQSADAPFRSDEMEVVLESGEGVEVKAALAAGRAMVFTWSASGPVELDMHGEPPGGEARTYEKASGRTSGHGTFVAPFTGRHGWFWQNLGAEPVKVTVRASGFQEKLFRP